MPIQFKKLKTLPIETKVFIFFEKFFFPPEILALYFSL